MESLSIFAMLIVVTVCFVILSAQGIQWALRKRLSRRGWIISSVALLFLAVAIGAEVIDAGTEYNPSDATMRRIAGRYTSGDSSLVLKSDGTYLSRNLNGLSSGTWNHFDWNLSFSGSSLDQPRWITRRGKPAILPYYSGPDGSDGLLLKKQSE